MARRPEESAEIVWEFPRSGSWHGAVVSAAVFVVTVAELSAASVEFNRDIRPILSENCLQCHGQDASKREARLRLDDRESATRDRGGFAAVVPGKPAESEMILRITSTTPEIGRASCRERG